ncbi:MAG TPA: hypothetical protein VM510_02155, partial [Caulifigura sp.]|nr:hypothetical protein [Caulifigura sp.]
MLRPAAVLVLGCVLFGGAWTLIAEQPAPADARKAAQKLQADGNFKDAFEQFEKLALDPTNTTVDVVDDIQRAVQCLSQLQRLHDVDAFLEKVVEKRRDNWRVVSVVAVQYGSLDHHGYLIAGAFHRGYSQQGGQFVSSDDRDYVRSLQLFEAARAMLADEPNAASVGGFFRRYAATIYHMRRGEPW